MRVPPTSRQQRPLLAERPGRVQAIDNRRIARLAKLAGAPDDKAAGVDLHVVVGDRGRRRTAACAPFTPNSPGELAYAFDYAAANPDIIVIARAMTAPLLICDAGQRGDDAARLRKRLAPRSARSSSAHFPTAKPICDFLPMSRGVRSSSSARSIGRTTRFCR